MKNHSIRVIHVPLILKTKILKKIIKTLNLLKVSIVFNVYDVYEGRQ